MECGVRLISIIQFIEKGLQTASIPAHSYLNSQAVFQSYAQSHRISHNLSFTSILAVISHAHTNISLTQQNLRAMMSNKHYSILTMMSKLSQDKSAGVHYIQNQMLDMYRWQ